MKILTMTCSNAYNYGAVLQAYALQQYLESMGHSTQIINYHPPYLRKISDKYKKNFLIKMIRNILYAPDYTKSKRVFDRFKNQYTKQTVLCRTSEDIQKLQKADLYILGSDQIWNPYMNNGLDENYYLNIDGIRKVSYAASIGCEISDNKFNGLYQQWLSSFSHITVREKYTVDYLNKLGIHADYVVDPVYLLDKEKWSELCGQPPKEKYLVVYALHHIQAIYDYAKKMAHSLGVKMYVISVEIKEIRRGNDKFFWNPSVNDFLTLIKNAEAVVSNSFHGISFGIIFGIPVHIFDTEEKDIRLKNIIEIFNLKDRLLTVKEQRVLNNSNHESLNERVQQEINRSKNILNKMVGTNNVLPVRTLMLWPDVNEDIPNEICKKYSEIVHVRNLYKKADKKDRAIRKLLSKLNLSTRIYFDSWITNISSYDKIIIHANTINRSVPKILRKMGFTGRIIYWYWNPVCKSISPKKINRNDCELWSFSKMDCEKFNMKYNSTYFFEEPEQTTADHDVDLFFIGSDKGRYSRLMEIKAVVEQEGFTTDFRIIKDNTSKLSGNYSRRMNYTDVLERTKKAGAIVELLQDGQTGLSLRTMESLFLGKKMITDNVLLKEEPYYDERNIFIIENGDLSGLTDFLKQPYVSVNKIWTDYFDFKSWVNRFDSKEK